jgi:hypothetical protein
MLEFAFHDEAFILLPKRPERIQPDLRSGRAVGRNWRGMKLFCLNSAARTIRPVRRLAASVHQNRGQEKAPDFSGAFAFVSAGSFNG